MPCSSSKPHVCGVPGHSSRNIHRPRSCERFTGIRGIGDGQRERRAVVTDVHGKNILALKIDAASQSDRRRHRRRAVEIKARGVVALARIAKQVEFDRHAFRYPRSAAGRRRAVTQTPSKRPNGSRTDALNGKSETVSVRVSSRRLLESEIGGKSLDVDRRGIPGSRRLEPPTVGDAQVGAVQLCLAHKRHGPWCKSRFEIDRACRVLNDRIQPAGDRTVGQIRIRGNGLQR